MTTGKAPNERATQRLSEKKCRKNGFLTERPLVFLRELPDFCNWPLLKFSGFMGGTFRKASHLADGAISGGSTPDDTQCLHKDL